MLHHEFHHFQNASAQVNHYMSVMSVSKIYQNVVSDTLW